MKREPLTVNEIIHQSLINQYNAIHATNDDRNRSMINATAQLIYDHLKRQVNELYPKVHDNDILEIRVRNLAGRLASRSIDHKCFISTKDIVEEIGYELRHDRNSHFEKLFSNIVKITDTQYYDKVIEKLQRVDVHRDHAERLIMSLLVGSTLEKTKEDVASYPFYNKMFNDDGFAKTHNVKETQLDLLIHCVKYGLDVTPNVYLNFFKVHLNNYLELNKPNNLPVMIVNYLSSEVKQEKDSDISIKYCRFLENGTKENIMELINGLRDTEGYSELPTVYDDLTDFFKYNMNIFTTFMSILKRAIREDKGFKPIIETEYGYTIRF